jgi:hypothetical protein
MWHLVTLLLGESKKNTKFNCKNIPKLVRVVSENTPAYEALMERGKRTTIDYEGTGELMMTCKDLSQVLQYVGLDTNTEISFEFDESWS